jgi:hypothetical protein
MTRWGFSGELAHSLYIYCRLPGVESTDETVKLSHYVGAVLIFAVARPVGSGKTVANGTDESVFSEAFF